MSATVANRRSRSLVYGMSLLRQFTAEEPVRGIAELADALNVSRPTAHRYASTCLDLGYLEQAPMRRYRLTRRATEPGLAMLGSLALARRARPILHELRQGTGRTVSLAILDGDDVLYLQRLCGFAKGQYELERGLGAGTRAPARRTAAGKALLANPGEEADQSKRIHDDGVVIVNGGLHADACGLAISIAAPGERASAIELTLPAEAISAAEANAALGESLRAAATATQRALAEVRTSERIAG
jgi:DNA-binding IclR family transcriptional regulator